MPDRGRSGAFPDVVHRHEVSERAKLSGISPSPDQRAGEQADLLATVYHGGRPVRAPDVLGEEVAAGGEHGKPVLGVLAEVSGNASPQASARLLRGGDSCPLRPTGDLLAGFIPTGQGRAGG